MSDPVNHPPHYNAHPSGVEAIDVCEHIGFNLGNAVKYLWRSGQKGAERQDLEKALWYLRRETGRPQKGSGHESLKAWFDAGRAVALVDRGLLGDVLRELFLYHRSGWDASALQRMIERVEREVQS